MSFTMASKVGDGIDIKRIPSSSIPIGIPSSNNQCADSQRVIPNMSNHGSILANKYGASAALFRKYDIDGILGEGLSGIVVCATRKTDSCKVAIKFIRKAALSITSWRRDRSSNTTIPQEIFLLKRLKHKNIVEFIDAIEDEEFFYLIMERVGDKVAANAMMAHKEEDSSDSLMFTKPQFTHQASSDLFQFINSTPLDDDGKIDEGIIALIFGQVCDAIHYLHSNGYVHRDIKDENIIIDVHNDFKTTLVDFGAADKIPSSERDYFTSFRGTPRYFPPELFRKPLHKGPEVDVWCLGILLYTIAYRRNPFLSKDDIRSNKMAHPPWERSQSLKDLLALILQPDPASRPTVAQIKQHPFLSQPQYPQP